MNTQLPSQSKDYFGNEDNQVKNYDLYRPEYPVEFLTAIREAYSKYNERNAYLDIACGTGQLLFEFNNDFKFSLGTDISSKQLSVVRNKIEEKSLNETVIQALEVDSHILPKVLAEKSLPSKFNLITIGQALHWFEVDPFMRMIESDLLDKQSGVFAVLSYFWSGFSYEVSQEFVAESQINADAHFNEFYENKIKSYFQIDQFQISHGYPGYQFENIFNNLTKLDKVQSTPCSVDSLIRYVKTFSAYNSYVEKNSQNEGFVDPAEYLRESINKDLQKYFKNSPIPEHPIIMRNSYFLRIMKRII